MILYILNIIHSFGNIIYKIYIYICTYYILYYIYYIKKI